MAEKPTTEDPNSSTTPKPNAPIEASTWLAIKSKVKLPEKVAELRRKLYQKAKQEPKFRFYALYDRIYRRDVLTAAWWIVLAKNKSPGIDGVTCRDILDAPGGNQLQRWIEQTLEGRFRLTINRDKTKIVKLNDIGSTLDFMGYTFRYDRDLKGRTHRYLNIVPSRKALAKARDAIRTLTGPSQCFKPTSVMISEINRWSTGWVNYFGYGYPRVAFRAIHSYIVERLTNHLQRRSQRAYRPPEGKTFYAHVHDLGLKRL